MHLYLLKVLLVEYLWCNCFSVSRALFFYGVLLATWLLHLLDYMCLTWEFHVDVATVGYRLAAQQMRFYPWPVQSIHGKNRLIEKIVSPVLLWLVTACDTISIISMISWLSQLLNMWMWLFEKKGPSCTTCALLETFMLYVVTVG